MRLGDLGQPNLPENLTEVGAGRNFLGAHLFQGLRSVQSCSRLIAGKHLVTYVLERGLRVQVLTRPSSESFWPRFALGVESAFNFYVIFSH